MYKYNKILFTLKRLTSNLGYLKTVSNENGSCKKQKFK